MMHDSSLDSPPRTPRSQACPLWAMMHVVDPKPCKQAKDDLAAYTGKTHKQVRWAAGTGGVKWACHGCGGQGGGEAGMSTFSLSAGRFGGLEQSSTFEMASVVWFQGSGFRGQAAGFRGQRQAAGEGSGVRFLGSDSRGQAAGFRVQVPGTRGQTRFQAAGFRGHAPGLGAGSCRCWVTPVRLRS